MPPKLGHVRLHGYSSNFGGFFTSRNAGKTLQSITKQTWDPHEDVRACFKHVYGEGLKTDLGKTTTLILNQNHELDNVLMTAIKVSVTAPAIFTASQFASETNSSEWVTRINGFGKHMITKAKLGNLPTIYSEVINMERDIQGKMHLYEELEGVFKLKQDQILDLDSQHPRTFVFDLALPYKFFPICLFKNLPLRLTWNSMDRLFLSWDDSTPYTGDGRVLQKDDLDVQVEIHGVKISEARLKGLKADCNEAKGEDYKVMVRAPVARVWYKTQQQNQQLETRTESFNQDLFLDNATDVDNTPYFVPPDGTEKTQLTHIPNQQKNSHIEPVSENGDDIEDLDEDDPEEAYIRYIPISLKAPDRGFYVTFQIPEHMENNEHSRYDDGEGNDCIEEISIIDDDQVHAVYSAVRARSDNFFDHMTNQSKPREKIYFIPRTTDIYGFQTKGITDWTTNKSVKIGVKIKKYIKCGRISVWALYEDLINVSNASTGKQQTLPAGSTLKGSWVSSTSYKTADVVFHVGSAYYATKNNQGVTPTSDQSNTWQLLTSDDYMVRSVYIGANSSN